MYTLLRIQRNSEPLRRFIQHEGFTPQVNEIQNQMPSWIPGEDHLINFQKGDPYTKVDEGTLACLAPATLRSIQSSKASTPKTTPTSPS